MSRPADKSGKPRYVLPVEEAGRGLAVCEIEVSPFDVVYVKSVVEASEGLANVFAESGGVITLAAPPDRAGALMELAEDVVRECEGARFITRDRGA
jgi:hypothetical protein